MNALLRSGTVDPHREGGAWATSCRLRTYAGQQVTSRNPQPRRRLRRQREATNPTEMLTIRHQTAPHVPTIANEAPGVVRSGEPNRPRAGKRPGGDDMRTTPLQALKTTWKWMSLACETVAVAGGRISAESAKRKPNVTKSGKRQSRSAASAAAVHRLRATTRRLNQAVITATGISTCLDAPTA